MTTCQNSNSNKYFQHFINFFRYGKATYNLLKSSIAVSVSGTFRVYLAALLLGTQASPLLCLAGGLIIYSVYTLDRALGCKEDLVNRAELNDSCRDIGIIVSLITFLIGSFVFLQNGILWLVFFPFVTGFLYSIGLKIGRLNLRLKAGLGIKNLVVGLTWGVCTACVAGYSSGLLPLWVVFLLYGVKTAVNSVIDDFKDVKGDSLAGLNTLPACCGELLTRNILLWLHVTSHLIVLVALLKGVIAFEPLIIAGSFICGLICILRYSGEEKYASRKVEVSVFKDCESVVTAIVINILT